MARIDAALARGGLDAWETSFLQDMRNKLASPRSRLTEKQSRKLHDVLSRSHSHTITAPVDFARYRARSGRRGRRGLDWRSGLAVLLVVALAFVVRELYLTVSAMPFMASSAQAPAAGQSAPAAGGEIMGAIRVIDGDTVEVKGEHVRLVGLNTPETFEPRCEAELALGTRAKDRLRQLLASGAPTLIRVPCACPPGTEGTKRCNYGRSCGVLSVDGRDVAETLVGEGLAVAFHCGVSSCPPLPRPWCG